MAKKRMFCCMQYAGKHYKLQHYRQMLAPELSNRVLRWHTRPKGDSCWLSNPGIQAVMCAHLQMLHWRKSQEQRRLLGKGCCRARGQASRPIRHFKLTMLQLLHARRLQDCRSG